MTIVQVSIRALSVEPFYGLARCSGSRLGVDTNRTETSATLREAFLFAELVRECHIRTHKKNGKLDQADEAGRGYCQVHSSNSHLLQIHCSKLLYDHMYTIAT